MKKKSVIILKNQKGASAVIVAIVLAVLLGFTALAIDVGYMYTTRNELQNIADAAALAATGKLGNIYSGMDFILQQTYNAAADQDDINLAATSVALLNKGAGKAITIDPNDIIISKWNWEGSPDQVLSENLNQPDAVRVTARREDSVNNAVSTFFARIFSLFGGSHETFEVSAVATAALSGPSFVEEGELILPFGLASSWFEDSDGDGNPDCSDTVTFKSNDDCAGWHDFIYEPPYKKPKFDGDPEATSDLGQKCLNFIINSDGGEEWLLTHFGGYYGESITYDEIWSEVSPSSQSGATEFYFTEGVNSLITNTDSTNWISWVGDTETVDVDNAEWPGGYSAPTKKPAPLAALFDFFRFRDGDGNDAIWTASVPVYYSPDPCDPVNGYNTIIGYAILEVWGINPPPDSTMDVKITCELFYIDGRGGGGNFGNVKGTIPNLVQ